MPTDYYRPYKIAPQSNLKKYLGLVALLLVAMGGHQELFGGRYHDWFELGGVLGAALCAWAVRRD
jgi:hypothetical protein